MSSTGNYQSYSESYNLLSNMPKTSINALPLLFFNPKFSLFSGKMRSCICHTEWCSAARTKHLFGNRVVSLTPNRLEREIWIDHLEITGDDILRVETLVDPRVWVGHFQNKDFLVTSDDEGFAKFDGIDFKSMTKYRESDTGNSSLQSPPRPAATKNLVLQSFLGDCRKLSFADYILQKNSIESRRRTASDKDVLLRHHRQFHRAEGSQCHSSSFLSECMKI
jgi:hypothetical protein